MKEHEKPRNSTYLEFLMCYNLTKQDSYFTNFLVGGSSSFLNSLPLHSAIQDY